MADTYKTFVVGLENVSGSGGLATVVADVATLVADGASPTQAHVTTLATDFNAFVGFADTAAVLVNVDTTQVISVSVLRTLLNQVLVQAAMAGMAP